MASKRISRREFLVASATVVGGALFAACAPRPVETEPTEEPVAPEVVEATEQPTVIPTPESTATPAPTVVAAKFKESPLLAAKVAAGELPPIDERLPAMPLVLTPVNVIGKYGGRSRLQVGWLGGLMEESQYGYSPVRWVDDGLGISPGLLDTWDTNDDNSEWTLHMRVGIKWSDGEPCTMNDTMFWWENLTATWWSSRSWMITPSS